MSDWYELAEPLTFSNWGSFPAPHFVIPREGGNPRTNIPRKIANRDTTTYVNTATPLRLSGKSASRFPIRGGNLREVEGRHQ